MRHNKILTTPAKPEPIPFERLFDEISQDWESKAARLRARRWQILNQEIKRSQSKNKRLMHLRISRVR